ncbi:hypothetical protein I4U23_016942 [Adineta vaga]|nr:hypothetical protein I4U23_016942 [Adineta vaga]
MSTKNFLSAIRSKESENNYQTVNPTTRASGAYQFMDSTWKSVGGTTNHAKDASNQEQDQIASTYANHLLDKYNNDYHTAARAWNQGEAGAENNSNAGKDYADDIINRMNQY